MRIYLFWDTLQTFIVVKIDSWKYKNYKPNYKNNENNTTCQLYDEINVGETESSCKLEVYMRYY